MAPNNRNRIASDLTIEEFLREKATDVGRVAIVGGAPRDIETPVYTPPTEEELAARGESGRLKKLHCLLREIVDGIGKDASGRPSQYL